MATKVRHEIVLGIDIGTTSVAGVAVDKEGKIHASATVAHEADLPTNGNGVDEQDPAKLLAAVEIVQAQVLARLPAGTCSPADGVCPPIGWTGQMHGVVGVDAELNPVTNFVTWRDTRRYGGRVMAGWAQEGRPIHTCLSVCGLALARRTGRCRIDPTFLHAWYLDLVRDEGGRLAFPEDWLPICEDGTMLGDNQAGVYAAEQLAPDCAVVNLGTSGQLSRVFGTPFTGLARPGEIVAGGARVERRPYPGHRTLVCRASLVGGAAWSALRAELGVSWDELNRLALQRGRATPWRTERVRACADRIAADLFDGVDLTGCRTLVGVGNALVRNPALRAAVERRASIPCLIPEIPEMAAYGAALALLNHRSTNDEGRTTHD